MRSVIVRVEMDAQSIAREIDKELANIARNTNFSGVLFNTASVSRKGKEVPLFPLLDRGTRPHEISPGDKGVLANEQDDFIVSKPVQHPGTPPYDISARAVAYLEAALARNVAGTSTRALANRRGETIDFQLIRQTFINVLNQTVDFAAKITPASWKKVKASYSVRLNNRQI